MRRPTRTPSASTTTCSTTTTVSSGEPPPLSLPSTPLSPASSSPHPGDGSYDQPASRPVNNFSETLTVRLGLRLSQLIDVVSALHHSSAMFSQNVVKAFTAGRWFLKESSFVEKIRKLPAAFDSSLFPIRKFSLYRAAPKLEIYCCTPAVLAAVVPCTKPLCRLQSRKNLH